MKRLWLAALLVTVCVSVGCRADRARCREDYCDPCRTGGANTSGYAPFEDFAPGEIGAPVYDGMLPGPGG